jgi:hypothetical protein
VQSGSDASASVELRRNRIVGALACRHVGTIRDRRPVRGSVLDWRHAHVDVVE